MAPPLVIVKKPGAVCRSGSRADLCGGPAQTFRVLPKRRTARGQHGGSTGGTAAGVGGEESDTMPVC